MKNPFRKKDYKFVTAGVIIGTLSVGAAAYLFFTEAGSTLRRNLAERMARKNDDSETTPPEAADDHSTDYLKKPRKTPKTDREALVHADVLHQEAPPQQTE